MKIIKWGDYNGYGSIVEARSFFGKKYTYTRLKTNGLDKWVCREDGTWMFADEVLCKVHAFYRANYETQDAK